MVQDVPRIARRRKRQVKTGAANGELMRRELAHNNGTGLAKLLSDDGVRLGDVVDHDPGVTGGRHPADIDDVLDRDRYSLQRSSAPPPGDLRVSSCRVAYRAILVQADKRVQLGVERMDARQQVAHQ